MGGMHVAHGCCSGLDVHKKSITACLRTARPGERPRREIRTFGTMTADLLSLTDWLITSGYTTGPWRAP
jgi:hypothetical protein